MANVSPPTGYSVSLNVNNGSSSNGGMIAGICIAVAVVLGAVVSAYVFWQKKKRKGQQSGLRHSLQDIENGTTGNASGREDMENGITSNASGWQDNVKFDIGELPLDYCNLGPRIFTYKQLSIATKNFSQTELLGEGGFGPVYKGILPEDGTPVAVKCVSESSSQGLKEFIAEVTIISHIRHRHLVRLLGWCHENGKLLLVYDYMPNGSLDNFLFSDDAEPLDWRRRYAIVCGLGSALQYLHEECETVVIHRDVKASNVMLDAQFSAKLGDFGLARQAKVGVGAHTTLVAGTVGYVAPECMATGKATTEADVYSFGAVLLEVASGRMPSEGVRGGEGMLVDGVWELYGEGRVREVADGKMEGEFDGGEMERVVAVGLACSHPDPKQRPTIRRAVEMLQGSAPLPELPPSRPTPHYGTPPASMHQLFASLLSDLPSDHTHHTSSDATPSWVSSSSPPPIPLPR